MSEAAAPAVTLEQVGAVGVIRFNRPERMNAWGLDIRTDLLDVLRRADADPSIHTCVLTGAGRAFCVGANLKDPGTHRTESVEMHLENLFSLGDPNHFEVVSRFTKPLIAAVNRWAIGIGALLTLCCDVVYADETAQFSLPQATLGILPAYGGSARLAQWVGKGTAMEIVLSGRKVPSAEAHRIGWVQRVCPDETLLADAIAFAAQLAKSPPLGQKLTKESMNFALEIGSLHFAGMADLYRFMALTMTQDTRNRHESWRNELTGGRPTAQDGDDDTP